MFLVDCCIIYGIISSPGCGEGKLASLDIDDDLIICIEARSAEAAVEGSPRWAVVERMIVVWQRGERCTTGALDFEASAFGEGRV